MKLRSFGDALKILNLLIPVPKGLFRIIGVCGLLVYFHLPSALAQAKIDSVEFMQIMGKVDLLLDSKPEESLSMAQKAYSGTGNSVYLKGLVSLMLGKIYQRKRDYQEARKYYLESLKWREKWGDRDLVAILDMLLSENHAHLHQFSEAMEYGHKALAILVNSGNKDLKHSIYLHMGGIHSWANDDQSKRDDGFNNPKYSSDSALYYYGQAKKLTPMTPDQLAQLNYLMGLTYIHRSDTRAVETLQEALVIRKELQQYSSVVDVLQFLANAHIKNKNFAAAGSALMEARDLYKSHGMKDDFLWAKACWVHVEFYKAIGDYKNAYNWLVEANKARDRRLLADREGAIANLTVKYEVEKKEAQLKQQKSELARQKEALKYEQRIKMISLCGGVLALGGLGVFFYLYRKNRQLSRYNTTLVQEQSHRIKNNLQRLSSLMDLQLIHLEEGPMKQLFQENLSRVQTINLLHRHLYETIDPEIVMPHYLHQLMDELKEVYSIPNLQVLYEVESFVLPNQRAMSIGLIVNEIVTNAFKHAFSRVKHPVLKIEFVKTEVSYYLRISDNGSGPHQQSGSDSIGLQLVSLLVKELKGTFHLSQSNGTIFDLEFPHS